MVAHGSNPGPPARRSQAGGDRLWHSARALEFRFDRVKD